MASLLAGTHPFPLRRALRLSPKKFAVANRNSRVCSPYAKASPPHAAFCGSDSCRSRRRHVKGCRSVRCAPSETEPRARGRCLGQRSRAPRRSLAVSYWRRPKFCAAADRRLDRGQRLGAVKRRHALGTTGLRQLHRLRLVPQARSPDRCSRRQGRSRHAHPSHR